MLRTVRDCIKWVSRYQWALHVYCPKWSSSSINGVLSSLVAEVNQTEAYLEPKKVYGFYEQAAHRDLCDSFLPALGCLVLLQLPLALLVLPCLAFAVGAFLQEATMA